MSMAAESLEPCFWIVAAIQTRYLLRPMETQSCL